MLVPAAVFSLATQLRMHTGDDMMLPEGVRLILSPERFMSLVLLP